MGTEVPGYRYPARCEVSRLGIPRTGICKLDTQWDKVLKAEHL